MKKTFFFLTIAVAMLVTSCGNPQYPSGVQHASVVNQQTNPMDLEYEVRLQGPFLDRDMVPGIMEGIEELVWVYFPDHLYKDAVMLNQHLIAGDTVIVKVKITRKYWHNHKFMVESARVIQKQPAVVTDTTSKIVGENSEEFPVKKNRGSNSAKIKPVPVVMPVMSKKDCGCNNVIIVNHGPVHAPISVTIGTEQNDPFVAPQEDFDSLPREEKNDSMPRIDFN